jgi:hypothetical protein
VMEGENVTVEEGSQNSLKQTARYRLGPRNSSGDRRVDGGWCFVLLGTAGEADMVSFRRVGMIEGRDGDTELEIAARQVALG